MTDSTGQDEELICVPIGWFEDLLRLTMELDEANKEWKYELKDKTNDRIRIRMMALMGYSKSAGVIIKSCKRIKNN